MYNNLPSVVKCRHARVRPTVNVEMPKGANNAYYTGLAICGSIWTCPLCCHAIQETRRREIERLFDWVYGELDGKKIVMVTFTVPHYAHQSCKYLKKSVGKALSRMRASRAYAEWRDSVGYLGMVRALEVTWGLNGWNVHTHELFIVDADIDADEMKRFLTERWELACNKFGLIPKGRVKAFRRNAVDITDNARSSAYLAKTDESKSMVWGADREVTGMHLKNACKAVDPDNPKGLTPFQLVYADMSGVRGAWDRFVEYVEAFKGSRALLWSRGLKELAGIDDISEDEAAHDGPFTDDPLFVLSADQWRYIRDNNFKTDILDIAENAGAVGIKHWLTQQNIPDYDVQMIDESIADDWHVMRIMKSAHRYGD